MEKKAGNAEGEVAALRFKNFSLKRDLLNDFISGPD